MILSVGSATVVFSGLVLIGAAGVALWYVTHLGAGRPGGAPQVPPDRFARRRAYRRAVMVLGLVLVAGAFFYGVNFLRVERADRASAVRFVTYWTVVLVLALALLVLALVDIWLVRRRQRRGERDALTRAFRRGRTNHTGQKGNRDRDDSNGD